MIGYIYVIKARRYYKIGKTADLTGRFCALQDSHPERLSLYDAWVVSRGHMSAAEKAAHALVKTIHVRGEWFGRFPDIIVDAVDEATAPCGLPPYRLSRITTLDELKRHISVTRVHFPHAEMLVKPLTYKRKRINRESAPKAGALPG